MKTTETIKTIEENEYYVIQQKGTIRVLKLAWKLNLQLSIDIFKTGILNFARYTATYTSSKAVIDARQLDPNGDPFGWVSGQKTIEGLEEYNAWWGRVVAPIFNKAKILGLGVATGDPSAPGELSHTPAGVEFKIAYFTDLDAVLAWEIQS